MSSTLQSLGVYQNIFGTCVLHGDQPDETIDDEAPIVVEMNKQFSSPGSTVNLSGQDLSDWISMQSLCARLSRSDNAKSIIYLDHCNLGRHGAAIVSRSFTHVLIRAGNYVAKWLPLMHQNGRIIVLSMINNDIGPDGAAAVATMLRVNTSLRELNLRFNSLKSDGAQYLASALYVNNTLRFLCLSGNDLCGLDGMNDQGYDLTGISALCRSLHVNTRLKTLKIAENDIGNDGAKYIADALRENKCLSVLDLHGNCLFSVLEEEMSLIESEETKTPDFASSSISSDPNMSHQNSEDMTEIPKIEKHGQSVDVSDTGQVALKYELTGSEGGGSLLTAIGESKYLTSIDLSWNEMGPKSAILFASSLINNSTLTYLDLHGNFIGDSGVSALCIFLKGDSCKLNVLYIQRIGMTTCGSLLIAEVLGTNKTLTKLNMSHNIVESAGAHKIALYLRSNSTLKELNLRNCSICSEGISHLANMLQYNRSLKLLNISNNDIEDDGAIAISVTLSLNPTLETLDMSCYQSNHSGPIDVDDTPLAASTHSKRIPREQDPSARAVKTKGKGIGESGIEALAHAISGDIRLSQLILNGYDLSQKMCQDLLNAMNESRVCTVVADFKSYKWRLDEVLSAMKAERELLSSCYTPKILRVHLCGQSNSKKHLMLRGWHDNQQLPFWTSLFCNNSELHDTYGVDLSQLTLQNRAAEINFWCYDGLNQLHEIHRLHLRAAPLSVAMIAVSSVGLTGQCRSAAQVAAEVTSWIRLLITFGHQPRDISIVLTNGKLFDKAWQGIDPSCLGVPPSAEDISLDPSIHSNVSSERKDDEVSIPEGLPDGSTHTLQTQTTKASDDTIGVDESNKTMKSVTHGNENFQNSKQIHVKLVPSEEQIPLSTQTTEADIRRKFEESIHEQISHALGWKRTPQLFCWDEGENGPIPQKLDQWLSERYKSLAQHVQVPNLCAILRDQCLPVLRNQNQLQVTNMNQLLKHCKQYVKCLQLVELRQACQWLHLLGDIVIYDTIELDSHEKDMWNYLGIHEMNNSYMNDDHDTLQSSHHHHHHGTEIGTTSSASATTTSANILTTEQIENEIQTKLIQKFKVIEKKRLKIQIDLELMKKQAPKRNCKIILNPHWFCRHILVGFIYQSIDNHHHTPHGNNITPTPGSISTSQPWCNHEYKFSLQQITDYLLPYTHHLKNNITLNELLTALEVQRIGVLIPTISSFCVPSRLHGNKLKWLSERQVTKMSLSQYNGYGSRNQNEFSTITSAIGRRIKPKHPYIFPPSTFACLQTHVLHTWFSEKEQSWKYYKVVLWERGIGITIEQPPIKHHQKSKKLNSPQGSTTVDNTSPWNGNDSTENSKSDDTNTPPPPTSKDFSLGTGSGFICILIEMTSKLIQPDWTQNPDSVIDIMIWGEGACEHTQLPIIMNQFIQLIYSACQLVCQGALRSEGASVDALMPPIMNWLKVLYLRPGCFLHTLASNTNERDCGEYYEDADFNDPLDAPILVVCHHLQPRLIKSHLLHGYILSNSPGQGKGLLRSVFSSLERSIDIMSQQDNSVAGAVTAIVGGGGGGGGINSNLNGSNNIENNSNYDDYLYDIQSTIIASE